MTDEFAGIANELVSEEANDYLDERLADVEDWVKHQELLGHPADLYSLTKHIMRENNKRGPVIVALAAALWRLREGEQHADQ